MARRVVKALDDQPTESLDDAADHDIGRPRNIENHLDGDPYRKAPEDEVDAEFEELPLEAEPAIKASAGEEQISPELDAIQQIGSLLAEQSRRIEQLEMTRESRASAAGHAEVDRPSREAETRHAEEIEAWTEEEFEEPQLTDTNRLNLKARPGYRQRWCRWSIGGQYDWTHMQRMHAKGWRPRSAENVSDPSQIQRKTLGDTADCIVIGSLVLMEIPEKIAEIHARRKQAANEALEMRVSQDLFAVHEPGQGLGVPRRDEKESRTTVTVGRRRSVKPADD